jgi:hypothetical protein
MIGDAVILIGGLSFGFMGGFIYMDHRHERTLAEITNFNLSQINSTLRRLSVRVRKQN